MVCIWVHAPSQGLHFQHLPIPKLAGLSAKNAKNRKRHEKKFSPAAGFAAPRLQLRLVPEIRCLYYASALLPSSSGPLSCSLTKYNTLPQEFSTPSTMSQTSYVYTAIATEGNLCSSSLRLTSLLSVALCITVPISLTARSVVHRPGCEHAALHQLKCTKRFFLQSLTKRDQTEILVSRHPAHPGSVSRD